MDGCVPWSGHSYCGTHLLEVDAEWSATYPSSEGSSIAGVDCCRNQPDFCLAESDRYNLPPRCSFSALGSEDFPRILACHLYAPPLIAT